MNTNSGAVESRRIEILSFVLDLAFRGEKAFINTDELRIALEGEVDPYEFVTLCDSLSLVQESQRADVENVLCDTLRRLMTDPTSELKPENVAEIKRRCNGRLLEIVYGV